MKIRRRKNGVIKMTAQSKEDSNTLLELLKKWAEEVEEVPERPLKIQSETTSENAKH